MRATVLNANIRGHEVKENKNGGKYILVRYEEDETGAPCTVVDKNLDNAKYYKRDTNMNLILDIDIGKNFTNIRVIDAKVVQ